MNHSSLFFKINNELLKCNFYCTVSFMKVLLTLWKHNTVFIWFRFHSIIYLQTFTKYFSFRNSICCVFQPTFGCCAHPNPSQSTFLAILNLFCWFHKFFSDFQPKSKKKGLKKQCFRLLFKAGQHLKAGQL